MSTPEPTTRNPQLATRNPKLETLIRYLFPAIALGLAWAVRGHFGHEWGAAWAGGIGGMAIVLASQRADWIARLPVIGLLAAIGWGVGGMMSYGIVVGYGRGDEFFNVFYGLAMLAVIGGLYGFIGGGLLGTSLDTTDQRRPDWAGLITQMIAGAWLAWGLLIYQLEWFMTPPRSELWAACLGAAMALAWYLLRNGYDRALRVACFSALGGGFGFAFGNFLQVIGSVSGIPFNWWNVMEFSLGFFGGLGMAYGVFSVTWPINISPSKPANRLALLGLLFMLPATNLIQAFDAANFQEMATQLGVSNPAAFSMQAHLLGWGLLLAIGGVCWVAWTRKNASVVFFAFTALYILESHVRKGVFAGAGGLQIEQYLYWADLAILLLLWQGLANLTSVRSDNLIRPGWREWRWLIPGLLLFIALLAAVAINMHQGLPGAHERF